MGGCGSSLGWICLGVVSGIFKVSDFGGGNWLGCCWDYFRVFLRYQILLGDICFVLSVYYMDLYHPISLLPLRGI